MEVCSVCQKGTPQVKNWRGLHVLAGRNQHTWIREKNILSRFCGQVPFIAQLSMKYKTKLKGHVHMLPEGRNLFIICANTMIPVTIKISDNNPDKSISEKYFKQVGN